MRRKQRDYRREYREYHGKPEQIKRRAGRVAARRKMEAAGKVRKGDGKDVDHRNRNPRDNKPSNLKVTTQRKNRGWRKGKS